MSRSLICAFALGAALALAGCTSQAPAETITPEPPVVTVKVPPVQRWLRWQETVSTMSAEQLGTVLEAMADPGNNNQLFYYGLLRQQADAYDDWVAARDIFRQLQENEALTAGQRRLAGLLVRYNQSRINWSHSREELRLEHEELQEQLKELQEQNSLLEQQIKTITELEATISTRKED